MYMKFRILAIRIAENSYLPLFAVTVKWNKEEFKYYQNNYKRLTRFSPSFFSFPPLSFLFLYLLAFFQFVKNPEQVPWMSARVLIRIRIIEDLLLICALRWISSSNPQSLVCGRRTRHVHVAVTRKEKEESWR